ncbi:MAG: membrane or secreted protein [Cyclobacteriaceae bacterium]
MNKLFLLLGLSISQILCFGQSDSELYGAWKFESEDGNGEKIICMVTITSSHQVATQFKKDGTFISTNGGSWSLEGNTISETVEFDTRDTSRVGGTYSFDYELSGNQLKVIDSDVIWDRVDNGNPGALAGAWLMSGRKSGDEIRTRDTSGPRKTMKILSGTRFQWIAYNTETKQFMGTGGGTYTTIDGKYTETIEFFSRDKTRVGMSLEFDYELIDGAWHHSGKSSQGKPLYEVWSQRK